MCLCCHVRCLCHVMGWRELWISSCMALLDLGRYTHSTCVWTGQPRAAGNAHWPQWEEPSSIKVRSKERSDPVCVYRWSSVTNLASPQQHTTKHLGEKQRGLILNEYNIYYAPVTTLAPVSYPLLQCLQLSSSGSVCNTGCCNELSVFFHAAFQAITQSLRPQCTLLPTWVESRGRPLIC